MTRTSRHPNHWGAPAVAIIAAAVVLAGCGSTPPPRGKHPANQPRSGSTTSTTTSANSTATTTTTGQAPAGFSPASVTFVSADLGWVLGVVPAGSGTELAVAHTTDGGSSWSRSPAPHVTFGAEGHDNGAIIRFANASDGWIASQAGGSPGGFQSEIWSTTDGGASWHDVAVPGGGAVAALEASNRFAQLVTFDPARPGFQIYSTPATSDSWAPSATTLPIGAGPVPSVQLSLHGSTGWVLENDRTVVAGARLTSGGWEPWTPPCKNANGGGLVAASSTTDVVAVCNEGVWGPPEPGTTTGPWLFRSEDGGSHFAAVGEIAMPTSRMISSVTTPPSEPQVVVAGGRGLAATFDGGHTWATVYSAPAEHQVTYVGFTTASQGVAIVTGGTTTSTLLMTRDGGTSWSAVTLTGIATS